MAAFVRRNLRHGYTRRQVGVTNPPWLLHDTTPTVENIGGRAGARGEITYSSDVVIDFAARLSVRSLHSLTALE
jgi:hypothetical protein